MNPEEQVLLKGILFIAGFVAVLLFLGLVWVREQVKKDLFAKGLRPIRIRWHPFAYWSPLWRPGFDVIFEDNTGSARKGRCMVCQDWQWRIYVQWVSDDLGYLQKNLGLSWRIVYVVLAGFLIQFGIRSLIKGESIYRVWGKRPGTPPIHIRGSPAILLSLAAFCGAWSLLSQVAFQYDRGNRERLYGLSARAARLLGWLLFWSCLLVFAWQGFKSHQFP